MKTDLLAIAIPTHNRAGFINHNLRYMLEEIRRFSIAVYISDDSTNDDTYYVFEKLKSEYEYIYYRRNIPPLGHDLNCISTLSLPSEKYVWYLGDSFAIGSGGLKHVIDTIQKYNSDFIAVNSPERSDLADCILSDRNHLLVSLGWHLTLTGATIYSKRTIDAFIKNDINRCKNFPQTAVIFEYFARDHQASLVWINKNLIFCFHEKKSYWRNNIFEVFAYDWVSFVQNLPQSYTDESKMRLIRLHSEKTGIFDMYSFLSYRADGIFNSNVLSHYFTGIRKTSTVNIVWLALLSVIPVFLIKFVRGIRRKIIN